MANNRRVAAWLAVLLGTAMACAPLPDAIQPATVQPAAVQKATTAATPAGLRYEALVDPVAHTVTVTPVGMKTQAVGVFVRSANAVWNSPNFTFDLLVTNNSGGSLSNVQGVVLSTTPGSPSVTTVGNSGNLGTGEPYYDYGTLANGATGTMNWQFNVPGATPFRFGFNILAGGGVSTSPVKNNAPTVATVTPASPSIATGATTTITATTSDPNSDALTYSWSAPSGGSITGSGSTITYTAPGSTGTYPVNVTVDDGKGATATGTTNISVTAGGGSGTAQGNVSFGPTPTAAVKRVVLTPATATIDPGDTLTLNAAGQDNPGNAVATPWTWAQVGSGAAIWRGVFTPATSGNQAFWRTFDGRTDAGNVTITARSANNQTASMVVTVREKPPVVSAFSPAANVSVTNMVATPFSVTFHDPNGNNTGAPTVTVTPNSGYGYGGGSSFNNLTGDYTMNLNFTFAPVGSRTVTISQSDGFSTTSMTWNVTIL